MKIIKTTNLGEVFANLSQHQKYSYLTSHFPLNPKTKQDNRIFPKENRKTLFSLLDLKLDSSLTAPHRIYVAYEECEDIGKRYYGKWSLPVYGDVVWNWILSLKVVSKSIFAFEICRFGVSENFKNLVGVSFAWGGLLINPNNEPNPPTLISSAFIPFHYFSISWGFGKQWAERKKTNK